jgi:hypothetical protein
VRAESVTLTECADKVRNHSLQDRGPTLLMGDPDGAERLFDDPIVPRHWPTTGQAW